MKLFAAIKYLKGYWHYAILNIISNILFSIFSVVSITLVIPFLDVLFQPESFFQSILQSAPELKLNSDSIKQFIQFKLSEFIVHYGKEQVLIGICILVFVLTFLKNLFRYLAMFFIAPIRNGVVRDLRNQLMNKLLHLPLSFYSKEKKGDLISRMTTDVLEIEWSIMQTLELIFREPISILISIISMILISPYLTLYIFLLIPVAALGIVFISKSLRRSAEKSKQTLALLFSTIEESLSGIKVIKAFGIEKFIQKKFERINQELFSQNVKVYRKNDLASPATEVVVLGILMFILYLGSKLVFHNELSASAFIGYFGIASQIIPPIKQISQAYNTIQKGIVSEQRIQRILNEPNTITEHPDAIEYTTFKDKIEFKNVSFSYLKGDKGFILKNINLMIPKGKVIALVGQSGSGKTTLTDMLLRFYEPDEGKITIDGVNIRQLKISSIRNLISLVSQDSFLMNDTIKNNITFGKEYSDENIIAAAKMANAHEFIIQLPQQYNTYTGDRGTNLSGGQRQRISIARAILRNTPILILDEATSSLDTENEKIIQETIQKLKEHKTILIIAHRLSTIMNADKIIVLHKGTIVEEGTHDELLSKKSYYYKLVESQNFQ
ncbi:MAG: antibiotic ABC transporter ATP-binding protein [Bacteroidia bacterium]|nr:MAG: antibiotic ABC transporter ATP-binding protein [Bacteroidia bacterium]